MGLKPSEKEYLTATVPRRRALPYSHGIETFAFMPLITSRRGRRALPYSHGIETIAKDEESTYEPGAEHFPIHMGLKRNL